MEEFKKCVALAIILLLSLSVDAQHVSSTEDNDNDIAPLIFPKENVILGNGVLKNDIDVIFPTTNGTVPVFELPSLIPDDHNTFLNQNALDILNATSEIKNPKIVKLPADIDVDYYAEDSSEESDIDDSVEEVQADDKLPQNDNLEENYKSVMSALPRMSVNDYDDNTEVDHPMILKDTHILGIVGAVLAVLCVCLYLGIIVRRRAMFNRYGTRERLVNEDDFYSNKSIHHNI